MDTSFFYNTGLSTYFTNFPSSSYLPTYLHVHLKLSLLTICGHQVLVPQVLVLFSLTSLHLLPTCMSISNICSSFLYKFHYFPFSYLSACLSSTFISQHLVQTGIGTNFTNPPPLSVSAYLHVRLKLAHLGICGHLILVHKVLVLLVLLLLQQLQLSQILFPAHTHMPKTHMTEGSWLPITRPPKPLGLQKPVSQAFLTS